MAEKPTPKVVKTRGQPRFVPTEADRKQVETLAGYGVPHKQICVMIQGGIDDLTLKKYFRHELTLGKAKASAKIGKTLFQNAMSGNVTAQIWWTKTQMGWKGAEERNDDEESVAETLRGIADRLPV